MAAAPPRQIGTWDRRLAASLCRSLSYRPFRQIASARNLLYISAIKCVRSFLRSQSPYNFHLHLSKECLSDWTIGIAKEKSPQLYQVRARVRGPAAYILPHSCRDDGQALYARILLTALEQNLQTIYTCVKGR